MFSVYTAPVSCEPIVEDLLVMNGIKNKIADRAGYICSVMYMMAENVGDFTVCLLIKDDNVNLKVEIRRVQMMFGVAVYPEFQKLTQIPDDLILTCKRI